MYLALHNDVDAFVPVLLKHPSTAVSLYLGEYFFSTYVRGSSTSSFSP